MAGKRIWILTAVELEARAVAEAMEIAPPLPGLSVQTAIQECDIRLWLVGIGAGELPELNEPRPNAIIMAGLAGALDPKLIIGDLVVENCPATVHAPPQWQTGTIYTADRLIATPAEKEELFRATGAAAVDMENAAVRAWAGRYDIPVIVVRAISDRADQALDARLLRLVDRWGRAKPNALLTMLLQRPQMIPGLIRTGWAAKRAGAELGRAVAILVRGMCGEPEPPADNEL